MSQTPATPAPVPAPAPDAGFRFWLDSISPYAEQVDWLTFGFLGLLAVLTAPVAILLPYFVIKYRQGNDVPRGQAPRRNRLLELTWALGPLFLSLIFFWQAADMFVKQRTMPDDALTIHVQGKQWMWRFQHPGGQREIDTLHVPRGEPVKLRMISTDVIHSLFLPALRIKHDVLPDRYTEMWFQAEETGRYHILCAEFCGTGHSRMRGTFVVMEPEAYQDWLDDRVPSETLVERGEKLFTAYGCAGCHADGGSQVVRAPDLTGLWGKSVPLKAGGTVTADADYIRDSILLPRKHIVAGYPAIMPSFEGQIAEGDLAELVAYIQALGTGEGTSRP
ncbi:Cytochrome c oxidase polypeptide II [Caenispirillum salinarum AK4]|uniref:cytochrome-c oxidase n=1 Tax=Caenispirillum salinarum AK4 TaxID=1238182 RepID=K9HU62_9PROT|nr:cytochrome c oxidase subunit II [Caenispirillum salinarum]EKV31786.1 Cytochrome c oxidase polypeptide II [Caenispirillum salinarum AK4]